MQSRQFDYLTILVIFDDFCFFDFCFPGLAVLGLEMGPDKVILFRTRLFPWRLVQDRFVQPSALHA